MIYKYFSIYYKRIIKMISVKDKENRKYYVSSINDIYNPMDIIQLNFGMMYYSRRISLLKMLERLKLFKNLRSLSILSSDIEHLSVIPQLIRLEELILDDNSLTTISSISRFPRLRTISIVYNKLKTLNGVQNLKYLEDISCDHNSITNIEKLTRCKSLKFISARNNKIRSFPESLPSLSKLLFFDYSNNLIYGLEDDSMIVPIYIRNFLLNISSQRDRIRDDVIASNLAEHEEESKIFIENSSVKRKRED